MSEHTDNELEKEKKPRWSSWYVKQELIAGIEELMEDIMSQKGMKHELAEVKRDVGKDQTTTKIKPPLEAGQRTCSVKESTATDMEYRILNKFFKN